MRVLNQAISWQRRYIHFALTFILVITSIVFLSLPAHAATIFYVNTVGSDDNDCLTTMTPCRSISTAILKASTGDAISIADGVYMENLSINKGLTLLGSGANATYIDGASKDRVVHVHSGQNVSIVGVTIQNGLINGGDLGGGGVLNEGTLTISGSIIQNNEVKSSYGGGGINNRGVLNVNNSAIINNIVVDSSPGAPSGGGIRNVGGTLTIANTTIANNVARSGGGIKNFEGTVNLVDSTVSNNSVNSSGGGISQEAGSLNIVRSTISSNSARWGGGVQIFHYNVSIVNSTISSNSADEHGGGLFIGGVSEETVSVELGNASIISNTAGEEGGGIYASRSLLVIDQDSQTLLPSTGAEVTLYNSLVANNVSPNSPDCYDIFEDEPRYLIFSNGFNLIGKDTGCNLRRDPIDLIGTNAEPIDPIISPLRNNGGPTFTHELLSGSPAAENGPATCTTPDQRGYERPIGRNCDIGAVENENPPPASVDFIADKLEVTQVVQDLNNSVRLVAGKRTVVRFHVKATNDESWAYAELLVESDSKRIRLKPTSRIRTRISPDRGILNQAFFFELPTEFILGDVTFTAEINPEVSWMRRTPEDDFSNNSIQTDVFFENVPMPRVRFYDVVWRDRNGTQHDPTLSDLSATIEQMINLLPIAGLEWSMGPSFRAHSLEGDQPDTREILKQLRSKRAPLTPDYIDDELIFYGLLVGGGGGRAKGNVATGFYQPGRRDTAPHELGHNFGRKHTVCTGKEHEGGEINTNYPYDDGHISQDDTGDNALYGFDISTREIFTPTAGDLMSYCKYISISDYTYESIMNTIKDWYSSNLVISQAAVEAERIILVNGSIDSERKTGSLESVFQFESHASVQLPTAGEYAIRFEDKDSQELSAYFFEPDTLTDDFSQIFSLALPYIEGIDKIVLTHAGQELDERVASSNPPTVSITSPDGGEVLDSSTEKVQWSATDADGDPLEYIVQYSVDGGESWETLIAYWPEDNYDLQTDRLPGSDEALVRVLASDGFHTASDVSNNTFSVPFAEPEIEIVEPDGSIIAVKNTTVSFRAFAYDKDDVTLAKDQIYWSSNIDGELGTGRYLSIADLSEGNHIITAQVEDRSSNLRSDSVEVTVVNNPTQISPTQNKLVADTTQLVLRPVQGLTSASFYIDNQNWLNPISWNASVSEPWLTLSTSSGTTPSELVVSIDESKPLTKTKEATVTITSNNAPGDSISVSVEAIYTQPEPPLVSINNLNVNGASEGQIGEEYTFISTIEPLSATLPITYTWTATDQDVTVNSGTYSDSMTYIWDDAGLKSITVLAENSGSVLSQTIEFNVSEPASLPPVTEPIPAQDQRKNYLPLIIQFK